LPERRRDTTARSLRRSGGRLDTSPAGPVSLPPAVPERRRDFNVRALISGVTAAAAVLAAVSSVVALTNSWRATDVAARANEIAVANAEPKPHVSLIDTVYPAEANPSDPPCMSLVPDHNGYIYDTWWRRYTLIVDINNSGRVGVDLSVIKSEWLGTLTLRGEPKRALSSVNARPYASRDELTSWLSTSAHADIPESLDGISFSQMPIHLDPGATKRLALAADSVWFLPLNAAGNAPLNTWIANESSHRLTFAFADGQEVILAVGAPEPDDLPGEPAPGSTYPPC
jgi:hypothetical protein